MIKKNFIETFKGIILGAIAGVVLGILTGIVILLLIYGLDVVFSNGQDWDLLRTLRRHDEALWMGALFGPIIGSIMGGVAYLKD